MARNLSYVQEEMIGKLKSYGVNHGFAALGTAVVIVGPGEPFSVHSTAYDTSDLEKIVDAGFLERRKLSDSFELDIYAVK
jgi:hypothetical protein